MKSGFTDDLYAQQRAALVESLREKGIRDERVLSAVGSVPRERFVLPGREAEAYDDRALPFLEGQTVSQPYTVAFQTSLLDVGPRMKVLEVGTGSGYQAAVLAKVAGSVYTIERIRALFERFPPPELEDYFPNVHFLFGDGYEGYPPEAPFDRILLTAAAPELPEKLLQQLATNGLLVGPVGPYGASQVMTRISKDNVGRLNEEYFGAFSFVPMVRGRE
jgi:protein-L-isoaspartate(D-aspartate) O-methyltransferase